MSTLPYKHVNVVRAAQMKDSSDQKDVGGYYPPESEDEKKDKKRKRSNATVGIPESPKKKMRAQRGKLVRRDTPDYLDFEEHEEFTHTCTHGTHAMFKAGKDPLSICGPYSGYYGNRSFVFYKPEKQDDGSWEMLTEFRNTTVNPASDEFTHQVIYLIDVPAKTEEIFNKMK